MSDDLSIQQKRPSAMPYMLVGGAAGAGAGYVVNEKFISKPMSHEEIIAEVNSKDAFTKRTAEGVEHAGSWNEVKTKMGELEAAKAELAKAEQPVLEAEHGIFSSPL